MCVCVCVVIVLFSFVCFCGFLLGGVGGVAGGFPDAIPRLRSLNLLVMNNMFHLKVLFSVHSNTARKCIGGPFCNKLE